MIEQKTVANGFTWIPMENRKSRLVGEKPPRKAEQRRPLLWLARNGNELYLVNASTESLDCVTAKSTGFRGAEDDFEPVAGNETYAYQNVKPNEAVKVDHYDRFYDIDCTLQVYLKVQSAGLGCIEMVSPLTKGGVGEIVLLWDSGESGKDVAVEKCREADASLA